MVKAVLRAWDSVNWLATVEPVGTLPATIAGIAVARNIPNAEMVLGRYVAVAAFDQANPSDAVVIAVYT